MIKTKEVNKKGINVKSNKGITMVSLIITIVVLFIVSSMTIYTSMDRFEVNKLKKMQNDIELLSDGVANYYLKYNAIPVVRDKDTNAKIEYNYTDITFNTNKDDDGAYYIVDLSAMQGISLNYGKEGFENINLSNDVYIINEKSHHIYYVKGVELDGNMYHTILENNEEISDNIPPTKPEIRIISGEKNEEDVYTTEVNIEIIPGKDNWSGITQTTCVCNFTNEDGYTEQILDENITENKNIKLDKNGIYELTITTTDKNNNVSNNIKTIKTDIPLKLADIITSNNYGDIIEYEANGVKDWKIFFNDGENVFIITSDYIPEKSKPQNCVMESSNTYNMYWKSTGDNILYYTEINESDSNNILDRATKFKSNFIKENMDKDWNNVRAVKDLLNPRVWSVFAEGINGATAIGAPTLEMFAESWNNKYKNDTISYSYNENGYLIEKNIGLNSSGYEDLLYFPHPIYISSEWPNKYQCFSYRLAGIGDDSYHSELINVSGEGYIYTDWFDATNVGMRPVVCLPSNAVATIKDGVWRNLTVK